MKKVNKKSLPTHTNKGNVVAGDYYGTGVKQNIGTVRRSAMNAALPRKRLKSPPKRVG